FFGHLNYLAVGRASAANEAPAIPGGNDEHHGPTSKAWRLSSDDLSRPGGDFSRPHRGPPALRVLPALGSVLAVPTEPTPDVSVSHLFVHSRRLSQSLSVRP